MMYTFALLFACSTWVYFDASRNYVGKIPGRNGFDNISAGTWAIAVIGLWIIAFPLYLIRRNKLIALAKENPVHAENTKFKLSFLVGITVVAAVLGLDMFGRGLDRTPDFSSADAYREKINSAFSEFSLQEQQAFNIAIEINNKSIEDLGKVYKGKTFRQMALVELDEFLKQCKDSLAQLQSKAEQFKDIVEELKKVIAEVGNADIKVKSFGFNEKEFEFNFTVKNSSKYDFSSLTWNASLYLDDKTEPVAKARMYDSYERDGGLRAGQQSARVGRPDTFSSKEWVTLAVQNANKRRVTLVLEDVKDFSNKSMLEGAPFAMIETLKSAIKNAENIQLVLQKK